MVLSYVSGTSFLHFPNPERTETYSAAMYPMEYVLIGAKLNCYILVSTPFCCRLELQDKAPRYRSTEKLELENSVENMRVNCNHNNS